MATMCMKHQRAFNFNTVDIESSYTWWHQAEASDEVPPLVSRRQTKSLSRPMKFSQ